MKKLKLDVAQIQVLSFTIETPKGGGTVNAHNTEPGLTDGDADVLYGTTTINASHCPSCPYYCFDADTNPDRCAGSLAC